MLRWRNLLMMGLFMIPALAHAGQVTGTVTGLIVRSSDGLVYVTLSGTRTGGPTCATYPYFMIADENSNSGKKQFAMLLAAKASNSTITIVGRNTCVRWNDGEDIDSIIQ